MKKNLGLLFVFFIAVFITSCSKPLQPQYLGFENLQISKASGNESLVSANVKFYNPNNFPLELKHADINLFLNDKQAAHALLDTTINIPKLDSFYVPVSFNVSFGSILNNALQFLLNGKAKLNAEGYVRIKKSAFAFNVPIHYETYQSLDSLLQQIR
ncbi:MAG TPA: LEA type 2 family protein [Puia sp.]|nr:LEA type 2 family protein [Puia sp.]